MSGRLGHKTTIFYEAIFYADQYVKDVTRQRVDVLV